MTPEDPKVVVEELESNEALWGERADVEVVQSALDRLISAVLKQPWDADPTKNLLLQIQDIPELQETTRMLQDVIDGKAELK